MTPRSWLDDEPSASATVRQAVRLVLSGCRRPLALIATTLGFGMLLAGAVFFAKHSYAPRYVLRIVEPDRDPGGMPRPRRQFAEYVREAVFTSKPLLEIVRRHDLYPSLARMNSHAALESFREDIDVEVYRNYFVEERSVGAAPRSARLSVGYHHANRDVAVSVTRELGELVVQRELSTRHDQASRAAEIAKHDVDRARETLVLRRSEVALKREELSGLPGDEPERQVALVGLLGSIPALELRQDAAERREAGLALEAALTRRGIGMSFDVVDDGALSSKAGGRSPQVLLGLMSFALGLPLVAMAVGALAPRKDSV